MIIKCSNIIFVRHKLRALCFFALCLALQFDRSTSDSISIVGRLQILEADNFSHGKSEKHYILDNNIQANDNEANFGHNVFHLEWSDHARSSVPDLRSGMFVRVSGEVTSSYDISIESDFQLSNVHYTVNASLLPHTSRNHFAVWGKNHVIMNVLAAEPITLFGNEVPSKRAIQEANLRRIAVIIVNTRNYRVSCSKDDIRKSIWQAENSVQTLYNRDSWGTVEFIGDIEGNDGYDLFGPITIDKKVGTQKSDCQPSDWGDMADEVLKSQGVDLQNYQHRMYVMPRKTTEACSWEGLGWVGCSTGTYCRAWVNTCDRVEVFVHELGHNLGMSHASTDWGEKGVIEEYGDPISFMGNNVLSAKNVMSFNAAHKDQVGWFNYFSGSILTLDGSSAINGVYKVAPSNIIPLNALDSTMGQYPLAIKIRQPDSGFYYYVSFTTLNNQYKNKATIHYMAYASSPTYLTQILDVGEAFRDRYQRFSVLIMDINSNFMTVKISYGCVRSVTKASFSSVQVSGVKHQYALLSSANDGTMDSVRVDLHGTPDSIDFTFELGNYDSTLCAPTNYTLVPTVPSGWKYEITSPLFVTGDITCSYQFKLIPTTQHQHAQYSTFVVIHGTTADGQTFSEDQVTLDFEINFFPPCANYQTEISLTANNPGNSFYFQYDQSVKYNVDIFNADGLGCLDSTYSIVANLSFPEYPAVPASAAGWLVSLSQHSVTVSPNKKGTCIISIGAVSNDQMPITQATLNVFVIDASDSALTYHQTQTTTLLQNEPRCGQPIQVLLDTDTLYLSTRESQTLIATLVNQDPAHCTSSTFQITSSDGNVRITPSSIEVNSNATKTVVLTVSVPMYAATRKSTTDKTVTITASNSQRTDAKLLNLVMQSVDCLPGPPGFWTACPYPVDNTTNYFQCWMYFVNQDTWACPPSTWSLNYTWDVGTWQWNKNVPTIFTLAPGFDSGWIPFNVSLPNSAISQISTVGSMTDITPNTAAEIRALHNASHNFGLPVGQCVRNNPALEVEVLNYNFTRTDTTVAIESDLGSTVLVNVTITNMDSWYCSFPSIYTGQSADTITFGGEVLNSGSTPFFFGAFKPGSVSLAPGQRASTVLLLTSNPSQFAHQSFTNTSYNASFHIYDTSNKTGHGAFVNVSMTFANSCFRGTPKLTLAPINAPSNISVGVSRTFTYYLNVSNLDRGNCENTTYYISASFPSPTNGWVYSADPPQLEIAPNSSYAISAVNISTRENIPAGLYEPKFSVSDTVNALHIGEVKTSFQVDCPFPRPVSNIQSKKIIPFYGFGLQAGPIHLWWDPCVEGIECCCPCQYRIERDGKLLDVVETANYTDMVNLELGSTYTYKIITKDKFSRESDASVCTGEATAEPEKTTFKYVGLFVGCTAAFLGIMGALTFVIVFFVDRKSRRATSRGRMDNKSSFLHKPLQIIKTVFTSLCCRPCADRKQPMLELEEMEEQDVF